MGCIFHSYSFNQGQQTLFKEPVLQIPLPVDLQNIRALRLLLRQEYPVFTNSSEAAGILEASLCPQLFASLILGNLVYRLFPSYCEYLCADAFVGWSLLSQM